MPLIQLLATGPTRPAQPESGVKPHILLVLDGFPKSLGGGERVVLRLASLLPQYGFRASILTLARHPESDFHLEEAPCPVFLLPLQKTFGLRSLQAAVELRTFLRVQEVRIVQTFFESSDLWAGLVTKLLSSAKLVWSRRDMGILRARKHQVAYRLLRHLPDAVIAVSTRVADHVITEDGVPPSRVHVVHNGLDLDPARPKYRSARKGPVVTTIGNVRRVKGHDILLKAAARVSEQYPEITVTVAGEVLEPDFFATMQQIAQVTHLAERFLFLGRVTDLQKHLGDADVFVLPSRSEGFSNALVEAMTAGLPCIATDVGGNAEAVEHGVSGLIVPAEDPDSLAEAILRVLSDGHLAQQLGTAARTSAERNFSADAMLRKTAAIYRLLL